MSDFQESLPSRILRFELVGIRIRDRNGAPARPQDEGCARLADGKLRQEPRQPGVLDDHGKNALPLLIDVDRARIGDRRMQPVRMAGDIEPLRRVARDRGPVPFLVGDLVAGLLEGALLEFDVSDHDEIFIDPSRERALHLRDLHHLQMLVAELVGRRESSVGQAESDPRQRRL